LQGNWRKVPLPVCHPSFVGRLNLASTSDAIYSSSGAVLVSPPPGGFAFQTLGTEIDASATYLLGESVVLNLGAGHLFVPQHAVNLTSLRPKTLGYVSLTYRFSLVHSPASKVAVP
jgi:hypothetical protein